MGAWKLLKVLTFVGRLFKDQFMLFEVLVKVLRTRKKLRTSTWN